MKEQGPGRWPCLIDRKKLVSVCIQVIHKEIQPVPSNIPTTARLRCLQGKGRRGKKKRDQYRSPHSDDFQSPGYRPIFILFVIDIENCFRTVDFELTDNDALATAKPESSSHHLKRRSSSNDGAGDNIIDAIIGYIPYAVVFG